MRFRRGPATVRGLDGCSSCSPSKQVDSRNTHWRFGVGKGLPTRLEPGDRFAHLPHAIPRGRDAGSNAGTSRHLQLVELPSFTPRPALTEPRTGLCFLEFAD